MVARLSLLAKFSLLTLLCVVALGVALFTVLRADIRDRALKDSREEATHLAVGVAIDLLTPEELNNGLDNSTLSAMDEAVEGHRLAGEIVTAKVFDGKGRMAYAADRGDIGEGGGEHVHKALRGQVFAELED